MIVCNFYVNDVGNIFGNWTDVKTSMIKSAANCERYSSDVYYDIKECEELIENKEEFERYQIFYENGVHFVKTLQEVEDVFRNVANVFRYTKVSFIKNNDTDFMLSYEDLEF